jgi:hypothetical protein
LVEDNEGGDKEDLKDLEADDLGAGVAICNLTDASKEDAILLVKIARQADIGNKSGQIPKSVIHSKKSPTSTPINLPCLLMEEDEDEEDGAIEAAVDCVLKDGDKRALFMEPDMDEVGLRFIFKNKGVVALEFVLEFVLDCTLDCALELTLEFDLEFDLEGNGELDLELGRLSTINAPVLPLDLTLLHPANISINVT